VSNTQHVIPTNDLLSHRDNDCPCKPRIEGAVVIHNSWDGREQSEPGYDAALTPRIQLFKDGDQWCALAGDNIQSGYAGFGDLPQTALINLLNGHREPSLETDEQIWQALIDEEITSSRASELLGLSIHAIREKLNEVLGEDE
jgi:hypothetical protein